MTNLRRFSASLLAAFLLPALTLAAEIPIDGCVTAPGGRPVPGTQVHLRQVLSMYESGVRALQGQGEPEPVLRTAADDEGCFTLSAPDAGMWRVTVEAPGFVPMEHSLIPLLEEASLPLLELEPDAGLRVRIEDASGKPLPGARVGMIRTDPEPRTWVPARREGVSGADGVLRLPKSSHEIVDVWAVAPGKLPRQAPKIRDSVVSLRLDPGVVRTFELTRAEDGKPLAGALIWHNASRLILGKTGAAGEIALAMPAVDRFEILTLGTDGRITGSRIRAKLREVDRISLALPGPAMIQGGVEEAASRGPIAGAVVWPEHDPAAFVRANPKGKFRLPWTPGSGVRIAAAAPGSLQNLEKPLSAASPVKIALKPALRLDGIVVDMEGQPVAGAEVRALAGQDPESAFAVRAPEAYRTRGDASGRFRMPLPQGTYRLLAMRHGFAPALRGVTLSGSPGKRNEVRLTLGRGRSVTGLVVDEAGRPVRGAEVVLTWSPSETFDFIEYSESPRLHRARTGPEGRFEVSSLPTSWLDLRVEHPDFAVLAQEGIVFPEGSGPTDLGKLVLKAGEAITGVVVDPQGQPLSDTAIWLRPRDASFRETDLFLRRGPSQVTGPDGRFSIERLPSRESWTLYACRKGHPQVYMFLDEFSAEPLRIVLGPALRLSGRVVDPEGNPVPGASVDAALAGASRGCIIDTGQPPCPSEGTFADAHADAEGRFVLESLRPGFYEIYAAAEGFLQTEHGRLEVREDREPEPVEIVLPRGATLAGRILMPDGSPAAGAQVSLHSERSSFLVWTEEDGSYRLAGVEPGRREVSAMHAEGYVRQELQVGPGENRLDLTLKATERYEIRGRVLGPGGEPVEGAQVSTITNQISEIFTGADGSFTARADGGGVRIKVGKEGFASVEIENDAEALAASVLEVRLEEGLILTGRLIGLEPEEIPDASVGIDSPRADFRSAVFPDGTYRIADLSPGDWQVVARAAEKTTKALATLKPGEGGGTLDLVFQEPLAVSGRVLGPDGEGVPGATVELDGRPKSWERAETREDGSFEVRLESGEYRITATAPGHSASPERKLVIDGPVDGLDFRLERGLVLRGCIPGLSSRRDPGDRIERVSASDGTRLWSPEATLDAEGCYRFDDLSPGDWVLDATLFETRADGWVRKGHRKVSVQPGAETTADIDLLLGDLSLTVRVGPIEEPPSRASLLLPDGTEFIYGPIRLRDGAFRFERLREGSYRLRISNGDSKAAVDQPVHLTSDQEIVVNLPVKTKQ